MQPTEKQKTNRKNTRAIHFILLGLAALGLLNFCIRYLDVKVSMANPLIPESLLHHVLMPNYYALAMHIAAIALQVFALYKPQFSRLGIIAGVVLIIMARITEYFYYQFIT